MTHRPSCKACSMTAAATPPTSAGAWQRMRGESRVAVRAVLAAAPVFASRLPCGQSSAPVRGATWVLVHCGSRQWQRPLAPARGRLPLSSLPLSPSTPGLVTGRCFGSRPACGGSPPCEKWTLKPGRCAALGRGVCEASCIVEAHPLRLPGGCCADPSAAGLRSWSPTAPLQVLRSKALPERDFGEGVTRLGDR